MAIYNFSFIIEPPEVEEEATIVKAAENLSQRPNEKSESRRKDAYALASGEKSSKQLRLENGAFSFPNALLQPPKNKFGLDGERNLANRLYSNCSDSLFSVSNGVYEIEFDREAGSFQEALSSAIRDVNDAGIKIKSIKVKGEC